MDSVHQWLLDFASRVDWNDPKELGALCGMAWTSLCVLFVSVWYGVRPALKAGWWGTKLSWRLVRCPFKSKPPAPPSAFVQVVLRRLDGPCALEKDHEGAEWARCGAVRFRVGEKGWFIQQCEPVYDSSGRLTCENWRTVPTITSLADSEVIIPAIRRALARLKQAEKTAKRGEIIALLEQHKSSPPGSALTEEDTAPLRTVKAGTRPCGCHSHEETCDKCCGKNREGENSRPFDHMTTGGTTRCSYKVLDLEVGTPKDAKLVEPDVVDEHTVINDDIWSGHMLWGKKWREVTFTRPLQLRKGDVLKVKVFPCGAASVYVNGRLRIEGKAEKNEEHKPEGPEKPPEPHDYGKWVENTPPGVSWRHFSRVMPCSGLLKYCLLREDENIKVVFDPTLEVKEGDRVEITVHSDGSCNLYVNRSSVTYYSSINRARVEKPVQPPPCLRMVVFPDGTGVTVPDEVPEVYFAHAARLLWKDPELPEKAKGARANGITAPPWWEWRPCQRPEGLEPRCCYITDPDWYCHSPDGNIIPRPDYPI